MNTETVLLMAAIFLSALAVILLIVLLSRKTGADEEEVRDVMSNEVSGLKRDIEGTLRGIGGDSRENIRVMGEMMTEAQKNAAGAQEKQIFHMREEMRSSQKQLQESLSEQMREMKSTLERMRESTANSMEKMRQENNAQLDKIRGTVDEKLQTTLEKRISESFKSVSDQLEKVHKGLGEMQTLAGDVGGLKKVLTGVKTRGILGEIQLGAILEEILSPEQYETNVATVSGSSDRVEFAVKLPGDNGKCVYLPIDSKFPGERYQQLLDAQAEGDKAAVEAAYRELEKVITSEAKDIATKYIRVPETTEFGIMFLPFEGLYAEVVSHGMVEKLQRDYKINIAGPSTMAALLNSLQMGFKTLAIRRHSSEIFGVLKNVETEFDKFGEVMEAMKKHLNQTSQDLDKLIGTRSNTIRRQLKKVQGMDDDEPLQLEDVIEPLLGEDN